MAKSEQTKTAAPAAEEAAPRRGRGRPRKVGAILDLLDVELQKTVTGPDGKRRRMAGEEVLARQLVEAAKDSRDPTLIRQTILMARKEAREEALLQSEEQKLKERKLLAAAQKYEIENDIRKQRAVQRAQKEDSEAKIKQYRADQEELKTRAMIGEYVNVAVVRYYFSFFQRAIKDCFVSAKRASSEMKRLYAAGKDREAEKVLQGELHVAFSNAMRSLNEEMEKDTGEGGKVP